MDVTTLAALLAVGYFAVFGVAFVVRPELVGRFGLRWDSPAGRTEVRCYYGGVSLALAAFLAWLVADDLAEQALTGVLALATAVLVVRLVGTAVDGDWSHPYTRTALPVEALFVAALATARFLG